MAAPTVTRAPRSGGLQPAGERESAVVPALRHAAIGPFTGLFAGTLLVYAAALLFRYWFGSSLSAERLAVAGALFDNPGRNIRELAAVALAIAAAFAFPAFWVQRLPRLRAAFARLARRKTHAMLFTALLPLLIRLAMLPVLPVPQPMVADEFGYLLLADTFASGRIANPPHPLAEYLETIYVFQQPAYTSIYPVAPALLLAVPMLLGITPWLGVWLGVGVMCALMVWMLQGWMPPGWALAGGLIAACRLGIAGPWMNTYWGGAAAAAAGALVLGALPRIVRRQRIRDSLLLGLGLAVLAQSRPFEGALMSLPLMLGMLRDMLPVLVNSPARLRRVALPLGAILTLAFAATAFYNQRVTGNPWLPPYGLHQKLYGTPQPLYFQPPVLDAPGIHRYQDIHDVFRWQRAAHDTGFTWAGEAARLQEFWNFFLQPLLTLPLLALLLCCRSRRMAAPAAALLLTLAGNSQYPFFFPHYAAPLSGIVLLLVMQGARYLSMWRVRGFAAGRSFAALMIALALASSALTAAGAVLRPWNVIASTPRSEALRRLASIGGKHLVLVRYAPGHSFHQPAIYNGADIDAAPVVWARQVDAAGDRKLMDYFADRDAWVFSPDDNPPSLQPHPEKPRIAAAFNVAGRRDDAVQGISPGSIAVLLGSNFPPGNAAAGVLPTLPLRVADVNPELGALFALDRRDPAARPQDIKAQSGAAGLFVRFDGIAAPILDIADFAGGESIAVQVPRELVPGWTTVTLQAGEWRSTPRRLRLLPAAPGVFQMRMSDGRPRAVLRHAGGAFVDLEHPARRGEILCAYSTGLGPPASTSGGAVYPLVIGVDNRGARLVSVAHAAGMTGVEEVMFEVPADSHVGRDIAFSIGAVVDGRTVYSNPSLLPVN